MPVNEVVLKDLPPGPYSCEVWGNKERSGFVYLLDANGRKIGTFWGKWEEKNALAEFVIAAQEHAALLPKTE